MLETEQLSIIRNYCDEVFNGGNLAAIESYIASDYVRHDPGLPFVVRGPEGVRQLVITYRTAFPDLHISPEQIISDGDCVAAHWSVVGTHRGDLMGMAPTGKSIDLNAIEIFKLADGKIVEQWGVVVDNTKMTQQLSAP